jgi:hypothetical protein
MARVRPPMNKTIYQVYIDFLLYDIRCYSDGGFSWLGVEKIPRRMVYSRFEDVEFLSKYKTAKR